MPAGNTPPENRPWWCIMTPVNTYPPEAIMIKQLIVRTRQQGLHEFTAEVQGAVALIRIDRPRR